MKKSAAPPNPAATWCASPRRLGDREARRELKERHREEQEHVLFVRKVVERYVKRELQDQPAPLTYL